MDHRIERRRSINGCRTQIRTHVDDGCVGPSQKPEMARVTTNCRILKMLSKKVTALVFQDQTTRKAH